MKTLLNVLKELNKSLKLQRLNEKYAKKVQTSELTYEALQYLLRDCSSGSIVRVTFIDGAVLEYTKPEKTNRQTQMIHSVV